MAESEYLFKGFGVGGFRSFSSSNPAYVGSLNKIHLITGQNNSGKSALLDFACRLFPSIHPSGIITNANYPFVKNDIPQFERDNHENFIVMLCFDRKLFLSRDIFNTKISDYYKSSLLDLFASKAYARGKSQDIWIKLEIPNNKKNDYGQQVLYCPIDQYIESSKKVNLQELSLKLTSSASSDEETNYNSIMNRLIPWDALPQTLKVSAIRKTTAEPLEQQSDQIVGGEGLNRALLQLSNPKPEEQKESTRKYQTFLHFVKRVLNDSEADVRVPADASMITVKTSGSEYRALNDLGTGIEELIIIAAVVACNNNKLICIEEPKIHLHPALQARLLQYLSDDQENRFLIATHSPTIINTKNISVTHVTMAKGKSTTKPIISLVESRDLLDDLGAHASDLIQSNFIIWVEGPSDRIYVNDWIARTDSRLTEGLHYSIMFYGGKLLSACSANAETLADDLVNLFHINTHFCIIMDSDRERPKQRLARTKQRIIKECVDCDSLVWVTDARTIENYIPESNLRAAIEKCYPAKKYKHDLGNDFICPLSFKFTNISINPNKISIARAVVEQDYEIRPPLKKRIRDLVKAISIANGLTTS